MENSFLFIVPLTPSHLLNEDRADLQNLCFNTLLSQTYKKWKVIALGDECPKLIVGNENFVFLNHNATKEEKLQYATEYILKNNLNFDYLIRLDDDDLFNPNILETLKDKVFNIYVDLFHSFWRPKNNKISQQVNFWFPNSFIIKSSLAFTQFGNFPPGKHKNIKKECLLIENEHQEICRFFQLNKMKVTFANKKRPVYIRAVSNNSITSNSSIDKDSYYKSFGNWTKNRLIDFLNISIFVNTEIEYKTNFIFKIKTKIYNLKAAKKFKSKFSY